MTKKEATQIIKTRNKVRKEMHRMHSLWLKTKFSDPMFDFRRERHKELQKEFDEVSLKFAEALRVYL